MASDFSYAQGVTEAEPGWTLSLPLKEWKPRSPMANLKLEDQILMVHRVLPVLKVDEQRNSEKNLCI